MAAAVAQVETSVRTRSAPVERKKAARVRSRRKMKIRAWHTTIVLLFLIGLCAPFVYTTGYATLAKTGYSRSDYEVLRWKEKVENQRLKVLIDRQSSYAPHQEWRGATGDGARGQIRLRGSESDHRKQIGWEMATGHRGLVRKRTLVLFALISFLYLALGARLAYVQVINRAQFEGWSKQIRYRENTLFATRGCIYDRDKRVLALSIDAVTIYAHRDELKDIPTTARRVAEMLHADPEQIEAKLLSKSSTIWLARKVHPLIGLRDRPRLQDNGPKEGEGRLSRTSSFARGCPASAYSAERSACIPAGQWPRRCWVL